MGAAVLGDAGRCWAMLGDELLWRLLRDIEFTAVRPAPAGFSQNLRKPTSQGQSNIGGWTKLSRTIHHVFRCFIPCGKCKEQNTPESSKKAPCP